MRKHRSKLHNAAAPMVAVAVGLLWGLAANTACACEQSAEDERSFLCEGADTPEETDRWQARVATNCDELDLIQIDRSLRVRQPVGPFATNDQIEFPSFGAASDEEDSSEHLHLDGRHGRFPTLGPVPPAHGPPIYLVAPSHSPPHFPRI